MRIKRERTWEICLRLSLIHKVMPMTVDTDRRHFYEAHRGFSLHDRLKSMELMSHRGTKFIQLHTVRDFNSPRASLVRREANKCAVDLAAHPYDLIFESCEWSEFIIGKIVLTRA